MTGIEMLVETPAARALSGALLHSLWEGALAALVLAVALAVLRSPRARYAAACLSLLGMLAGFGFTFARLVSGPDAGRAATARVLSPARSGIGDPGLPASAPEPAGFLPWLAPFWMAGVLLFQLRGLAGWMAARRLRTRGVCRAPDAWQERLHGLRERVRLSRPVVLLESGLAGVPVVIGHLRPVILVPAGVLAGLPAGQIEAILLHELAHIRRCDYLVNLAQTLVEGLLFYHPAAWWISGVIRAERENCCDDVAVALNGDAHEYAAALAALEQNRWAAREAALAATGGNLMKRIRRLLDPEEGPRTAWTPVLSAGVLMIAAALALAAWQAGPQTPARPAVPSPYSKWLNEDVVYIITDRERAAFTQLTTDAERERFIEQFWLRRDPTPGTPQNEFKEEHYRRIAYANKRFGDRRGAGWKTDRGRIYILYGPPDEIESHPSGGGPQNRTYPFEQWRYRHIGGVGDNVIIDFVDKTSSGEYHMTTDPHGKKSGR